jgi:hypothetical protein
MSTAERILLLLSGLLVSAFLYGFLGGIGYEPCCGYPKKTEMLPWAVAFSAPVWLPALFRWAGPGSFGLCAIRWGIVVWLCPFALFLTVLVLQNPQFCRLAFDIFSMSPQTVDDRVTGVLIALLSPVMGFTLLFEVAVNLRTRGRL